MLNDKIKGEWRTKVKSIFTEAQKKFEEQEEETGLDLGADAGEDPAVDSAPTEPVDGEVDPVAGEVEEEEPTIVLTASLLKALLDYCSAPDEEEVEVDAEVEPAAPEGDAAPVAEVSAGNPSMTAPVMTTNTGVMENAEVTPPVDADPAVDAGDDALDAGAVDAEVSVDGDVADEEVSSDEIVQRLIDLSADAGGEALDVDVLAVVFSPAGDEGEDLGGDDLEGNVELPATTGDQTVPADAPAPVTPAV